MSTREEFLQRMFSRWLRRMSVPLRFQGDSEIDVQTRQDEADALLYWIVKRAPESGYERWLQKLLDDLELSRAIPNWPTVREVTQSASKLVPKNTFSKRTEEKKDRSLEIASGRILRGERIEFHYLTGSGRQKLIDAGLVTVSDIEPYLERRSACTT